MSYWKRKVLDAQQRHLIEEKIKRVREVTGVELLVAIGRSSSRYATARLRFATSFMFVLSLGLLSIPELMERANPQLIVGMQLIVFSTGLLLGGMIPPIKRLFLLPNERLSEVRSRARDLFQMLGLPQLDPRTGALLYLSVFEKRIELVIDDTLKERIRRDDMNILRDLLNKQMEGVGPYQGLSLGLDVLEEKLMHFYPHRASDSKVPQLSHHIIWPDINKKGV